MKNNRQFNLKEILTKEFGFTPIDLDRYHETIHDLAKTKILKDSVLYVKSKPNYFKTKEHKRNTLLKKCKELAYEVNIHNTTFMGDFIQNNFNK